MDCLNHVTPLKTTQKNFSEIHPYINGTKCKIKKREKSTHSASMCPQTSTTTAHLVLPLAVSFPLGPSCSPRDKASLFLPETCFRKGLLHSILTYLDPWALNLFKLLQL